MALVNRWLDKYKLSSLKAKILLMVGSMLTVFTVVAVIQVYFLYSEQKGTAGSSVQGHAISISSHIGQKFEKHYWGVQNFAQNRVYETGDVEGIQKALDKYVSSDSAYDLLLYVSANGEYVASNSRNSKNENVNKAVLMSINYSSMPWFTSSLSGKYSNDLELNRSGTYLENAQFDPISAKALGKSVYGLSFSTSVKDSSGNTIGVLTLRTNFSWVASSYQNLYESLKTKGVDKAEFYLVSKSGNLIFSYEPYGKGSMDVGYDRNELGSRNLSREKMAGVTEALNSHSGYLLSSNSFQGKHRAYVGYTSLESDTHSELGWATIIKIEESELTGSLTSQTNVFYGLVVLICCGFLLLSWKITSLESDKLVFETNNLKQRSASSISTSGNLNNVSSELSDAARQQQEAVQETMAALDQMMSMLSNTNKYVEESLQSADGVNQKSKDGSHIMNQMQASMGFIQNSNKDLESMAKIIQTISEKTNVINEIVFNTKLLAFNASIEAARAGVHGKGFAVVAEEVGNLAQLSGEAAKDIDSLIKESQTQVLNVVGEIGEKISQGDRVANEATEKFSEIAQDLTSMTQKVRDILGATAEQEAGIKKVNEAMRNIDDLTHKNLSLAHDSDSLAKSMNEEAQKLESIMEKVRGLILGSGDLTVESGDKFYKKGGLLSFALGKKKRKMDYSKKKVS